MKRLINVRLPFFCVIAFALGIYSAYELYFGNYWWIAAFSFAAIVVTVAVSIIKRRLNIVSLFISLFILFGFAVTQLTFEYSRKNEITQMQAEISGRVCDIGRNGVLKNVVYLENCTLNGGKLKGKTRVIVYDGASFQTGDEVTAIGTLRSAYAVQSDVKTSFIRHSVKYELTLQEVTSQKAAPLKIDEAVRLFVYNVTKENMSSSADIMYALLCGDRNAMDETKSDAFAASGISHLLAVSGLHVGFLSAVLCFFIKRFKLRPLIELSVIIVPLVFYAYICGFSPSVIRALTMLCCVYLTKAVFGSYDMLTSLSFASFIILFISPLYLFDAGFQLSVLSVFGISTLYMRISRFINKRKICRFAKFALNSVSISFSCTLSTFFSVAIVYGKVPTLGVLVNLIAIPLVSVSFVLGIFGLIPWAFRYLLWLSDKFLLAVSSISVFISELSFSVVRVYAAGVSVVIIAVILFVLGGYVNLKKKGRAVCCCVLSALLIASEIVCVVPRNCGNSIAVFYGYNDVVVVATAKGGETAVIGNFSDSYAASLAEKYFNKMKISDCTLYVTRYSQADTDILQLFTAQPKLKAYILDNSGNDSADELFCGLGVDAVYQQSNSATGGDVKIQSVYVGSLCGAVVSCGELTAACLFGSDAQNEYVVNSRNDLDAVVLNYGCNLVYRENLAVFTYYQTENKGNYGANKYGNFTITEKDDKITLSFR